MKKIYQEEQVKRAISQINTLLPDSETINNQFPAEFYNTKISQDFTRKDLKRINVSKCEFDNSKFNAVAATGSKFASVIFENCDFSGANFQYCDFNRAVFRKNTLFKGANFSHSMFINCIFEEMTIMECTLFDCDFENCTFISSTIRTNTFENSVMHNCTIKDIDLAHINLDYMRLDGVNMENVILPPYQIPYIIGAPTYLKQTMDSVYVYTDNGNITCQEYCNLYSDLAIYFYSHGEYFPLANIYIALGKHELAFECIQSGIREAFDYLDFRMVKHLCKLACSNDKFSHTNLKMLYDLVTNLSYNKEWDVSTLHSYLLNIGEIRELLLNNAFHSQRVEFLVKTNIDKDDLTAINALYNKINEIIRDNCSSTHIDSIELRHNSPYELYITCIDMLPNVIMFIGAMYSVLAAGNKFLDIFKNYEETRRVHQENKMFKYEQESIILDIEIKKRQLEQMNEESSQKRTTFSSGIYVVNEIEHNIKCSNLDIAKNIAPEYLHYRYSKNNPEQ